MAKITSGKTLSLSVFHTSRFCSVAHHCSLPGQAPLNAFHQGLVLSCGAGSLTCLYCVHTGIMNGYRYNISTMTIILETVSVHSSSKKLFLHLRTQYIILYSYCVRQERDSHDDLRVNKLTPVFLDVAVQMMYTCTCLHRPQVSTLMFTSQSTVRYCNAFALISTSKTCTYVCWGGSKLRHTASSSALLILRHSQQRPFAMTSWM